MLIYMCAYKEYNSGTDVAGFTRQRLLQQTFELSAKEEDRQNKTKMRNFSEKHSFMDPLLYWPTTNRI